MWIKGKALLAVSTCLFFFFSCEKDIKLNVENQSPELVVDASIENGQAPLVVLSTSLNYFGRISPKELSSSFVHDAVVTIDNGTKIQVLKEYALKDDSSEYTLYYYTIDSSQISGAFMGAFNHEYGLSITTSGGKNYTASTFIPSLAKTCDSLWWLPAPASLNDKSLIKVMGRFTDPKGYGNYVRVFTKVNSEPFYPEYTSAFDDQFTDGTNYDFQVSRSYRRGNRPDSIDSENAPYFNKGDTATLKMCNINKASYDFWRTWDYNEEASGNPFSSPIKVLGNISNNALGAFTGYAAQYKTILIPK